MKTREEIMAEHEQRVRAAASAKTCLSTDA